MKWILMIFLLFLPISTHATISVIQSTGSTSTASGTAASVTATFTSSSTINDAIILFVQYRDSSVDFTITDSGGNNYTSPTTWNCYGNDIVLSFNVPNASIMKSLTVTPSKYAVFNFMLVDVSGAAASNIIDKTPAAYNNDYQSSGAITWTGNATGTLSQADELILVFNDGHYDSSITYAATGYTQYSNNLGRALMGKTVSSTASVTPSGTGTASGDSRIYTCVQTFIGGSGGVTSPPVSNILILE